MINTKKIGSVLKNINNIDELSISDVIDCNQGQLIAVKVISVNPNYNKLELVSGRITELLREILSLVPWVIELPPQE